MLVSKMTLCAYLCLGLAVGCGGIPSSSSSGKDPGSGGKADTATSGPGQSSSPRADPQASYFQRRSIQNLSQLGAFNDSAVALSVARRIDGIIASKPADDWIDLEELERMDTPPYDGSLFPEEEAVLDRLWELMRAPDDVVTVTTGDFTRAEDVKQVLPAAPSLPDRFTIVEGAWTVRNLQRLELQFDDDADATTVSLVDLEAGINDAAGRYTPAEIKDFEQAREHISRLRAKVVAGPATLVVPGLGQRQSPVGTLGGASLALVRRSLLEERSRFVNHSSDYRLTMRLRHEAELEVGLGSSGTKSLVIFTKGEKLTSRVALSTAQQRIVVETWHDGKRTGTTWVELPEIPAEIPLDDSIGYRFEDENGNEHERLMRRYRQVNSGSYQTRGHETVTYSGVIPRKPMPGSAGGQISGEAAKANQWGRYELTLPDGSPIVVEIYNGGTMPVIWVELDGERMRATRRRGWYGSQSAWTAGVTAHEYGGMSPSRTPHLSFEWRAHFGELVGVPRSNQSSIRITLDGLSRVQ